MSDDRPSDESLTGGGRWPEPVRRLATVLALLLVGMIAGAVGFALQPAVSGDLGPGTVSVEPSLRGGDTVVALPPLGEMVADTHDGPLSFAARVDRIDLDRASVLVRDRDPGTALRDQIEGDLGPLLRSLARQSLAVAVASGVVAGLLLPRRRVRYVATVVIGSMLFVGVGGAVALRSFEPRSFDQPRFEGDLARAPDIVSTVQRHVDDVSVVEGRLEILADRIVGLYRTIEGDAGAVRSDTTILHVSDLHSNPLGIELVEETAERFDVDAIIDTGDLTSFGADVELAVVDRIARIDTPYFVAPGNHDHGDIRRALDAAGVAVLDGDVVEIGGVEVLGVADPTFTAANTLSRRQYLRRISIGAEEVRGLVLRTRPDVVAVHSERMLARSLGQFPVGIVGHLHKPGLEYQGGSAVAAAGSAGATGVGALMTDEDLPYQMQLLHFDDDARLEAIDRLEFQGTDGEFQLERVLIDASRIDRYRPQTPTSTRQPPR